MSEPNTGQSTENTQADAPHSDAEAWREVGRQFKDLGQSIAAALQAAWKDEEVRRQAQEMKTGLESLVSEVGRAIDDTANSPQVRQATSEAARATRQAAQQARPKLVEALKSVNQELQTLIARMEARESPRPGEATTDAPGEQGR
jgi:hypothetical protein